MSSTMLLGGRRPCTRSIPWPDKSAIAQRFSGAARHCRSKPPTLPAEAAHLPRASTPALSRLAANNPAHRRIMTQALGVIHILVSGKATKYRLSEQPGQCMPTILAGACVGQNITCHRGQAECVVEFAIG